MRSLSKWTVRLAAWLTPSNRRREFRAEWDAELATDPSMARAVGAIPDAWCLFRQQWSADMLLQDVRYAVRLVRQRPGFTTAIVLTLALGIGANTAVFTVINGVLLRPLPFGEPDRLAAVWEDDRLNGKSRYQVAPANFVDWRDQTRAFEQVAAFTEGAATFATETGGARVPGAVVTTNFFATMGVRPELGDDFSAEHAVPGRHRAVILSHQTWQRYFRGDPGVIGRSIDIGAPAPYRVVGVMPASFRYPGHATGYWRPMPINPEVFANRALHFLSVVARLRPGVTLDQAQADMDAIAARQQRAYPATNDQRGVTLVPMAEQIVGDVRRPLIALGAAVLMVLLIGCANVGNLLLMRAATRRRELALRAALGADRMRIARQLLVEGLTLAGAGAAAGLVLAGWATAVLRRVAEPFVPRIAEAAIDIDVLLFLLVVSLLSGVLFALAPVLTSSRPDVRSGLEDGARTSGSGPAARRLRAALAVGGLAMAFVLVIGAGLVLKSFWRLMQVSPGFATDRVLTAQIELPQTRYANGAQITLFYTTLFDRLHQLPGVIASGGTSTLPMAGSGHTTWLAIEGQPKPAGEPPEVNYRTASADYFRALDVPVVAGRAFGSQESATSPPTVVINTALVERFFRERDPLGQRIRIGPNPNAPWLTIVGVVGDMRQSGPAAPVQPELYLPIEQDVYAELTIAIRSQGDPLALSASLRDLVRTIDPQLPVVGITTMEQMLDEHVASRRLLMILLAVFAGVALLLALTGVYGVMGHAVSQRTNEIGVRMALGAQRHEIMGMVLRDGARLTLSGLLLGLALALVATRFIAASLYGITATDRATYAAVLGLMLAVALLACYLPARRAARVDPLSAIRAQ